jgi:hypothetical protein
MKVFNILAVASALIGCKDDPVNEGAGMYIEGGKDILFTQVSVYTVTQKKVSGGSTFRRGYTTHYLTSTDLASGQELKRLKIGDHRERVEFLGSLGGRAWFYSHDPALGLHSRHPQTLAVELSSKDMMAKNSALAVGFTEQARQQGLDTSGRHLFASTKDGYHYRIDPQTLMAVRTEPHTLRRKSAGDRATAHSCYLNDTLEVQFVGSGSRKELRVERKRPNEKSNAFFFRNKPLPPPSEWYYETVSEDTLSAISLLDPEWIVNTTEPAPRAFYNKALSLGNTLFVLSKSLLGNEYHWLVTALEVPYTGEVRQLWQHALTATGPLAYNEKKLLYAGVAGNKLVLVFANGITALEVGSGKVLWSN